MKLNNKIGLGIIGEKFTNSVAKSIFRAKDGYRVEHVDWDNYSYGHGLDLRVFKRNKQVIAVEVKNWRQMNRPYGAVYAEEQILDRFKNYAGGIKVLIISFLCLLTKKALELLEAHDIHVIEIGKLVGKNDFPRKGKNNKTFYSLKSKLSKLWRDLKHAKVCSCVSGKQLRIDTYDSADTYDLKGHNNSSLKQHDTDSKKVTRNYAMNILKRALRIAELKRKHPMYRFIPESWLD